MPSTIEVYGSLPHSTAATIARMLRGTPYEDETSVVSIQCYGAHEYMRVWVTDPGRIDALLRRLEPLGIEIQIPMVLHRFVPRRSMRQGSQGALPLEPFPEGWHASP